MGGGDKGSETTVVQMPPQPAAPSATDTAENVYAAQLKYNPQLYQQYAQSYQQYMPQIAGTDLSIQQQYAPQLQALQQRMYPQQTQLIEALSQQALGRLASPYGTSTQEDEALNAARQRQREELIKQLRNRENLGGGLYGGRAASREEQAMTELEQAFTIEDMNRRQQAAQQALAYTTPVLQIQYPQVQQPNMPNYWQSVTPSSDSIYNAMYGASRNDYYVEPGRAATPSPWWNLAGQAVGAAGQVGMGMAMASSERYKTNIRKWNER